MRLQLLVGESWMPNAIRAARRGRETCAEQGPSLGGVCSPRHVIKSSTHEITGSRTRGLKSPLPTVKRAERAVPKNVSANCAIRAEESPRGARWRHASRRLVEERPSWTTGLWFVNHLLDDLKNMRDSP